MPKKLFIISYGCQMNEYDSAKIADLLAQTHGFTLTEDPKLADLIVLNTCSIRDKAAGKVFSDLGRLRLIKKTRPDLILAVGGCVSVQEKTKIFQRAPYVSIVFGPQTLHLLPNLYERALKKERKIIDITSYKIEKFDYFPTPTTSGPAAYVSIIEGCNKYCSYCIVPYTRGIEASRKLTEILAEVKNLALQGAKEIHLLGQNVNAYRDPTNHGGLAGLIHEIANLTTIERIRFTTSHPAEFSDDLIQAFKTIPKLANHLHLPIQSGSDRILQLMRRNYTTGEYQQIIAKLRAVRPMINISSDFIVGFPSETDEDFAATIRIIQEINFDASYSFIYSPRPNTPAAKMVDDVTLAQKKERLLILQNQLASQARNYSKQMVGTIQRVLVTDHAKKNPEQFSGRTENNRVVNFTASQNVLGKMVEIKITEALPNSLRGKPI